MNISVIIGALAAGLVVVYLSIKNTKGPRERNFVILAGTAVWACLVSLVALDCYFLHGGLAMKVILGVAAFCSFFWLKRKQREIRRAEGSHA